MSSLAKRAGIAVCLCTLWNTALTASAPEPIHAETQLSAEPRARMDQTQDALDALPSMALTGSILFRVLAAEMALQRHLSASAYQTYLVLARETHDPRMAQRAAEIALRAHTLTEALTAARIWRRDAPASRRALRFEAKLLMLNGHFDEAQSMLAAELADVPEARRGAEVLALQSLLASSTEPRRGVRILQTLLQGDLQRAQAQRALARQHILAGQTLEAQRALERALALKQDDTDAAILLAQLGPEPRQQAIRAMRAAVAHAPDAREARLTLAKLYLADQQADAAQHELQALHAQRPNDLAPLMGLAQIYLEQKRHAEAEHILQQYLQAAGPHQDTGQAYLYLAFIAAEKKDLEQAMQWLNKVNPHSSRYIPAGLARVQLLAQAGKIEAARALLARLTSNDPQIQILIARIDSALLLDAKQSARAETRLAQAYEIWPNAPELIYDYAMVAERNGHYAQMETLLYRLIDLRPHDPEAYNALGYSLADRGQQLNKAEQLIEKAVQRAPENSYFLDSLGWVKYRLGDMEQAAALLQRAYQIEARAEIGAHWGEVLWRQGRQAEARRIWRDALHLEPNNSTVRKTMQRFLGQP